MFKLPPGVLSANNMHFLVDRELKQHHRYHTPFSIIMLSLEGLLINDKARRPTENEYQIIVPKLFSVAKMMLRDIDLVGTLGPPHEKTVFSVLAMTGLEGATIAEGRILKKIADLQLKAAEGEAKLITAASLHIPGEEEKPDIKKFLSDAFRKHEDAIKTIDEQHFS